MILNNTEILLNFNVSQFTQLPYEQLTCNATLQTFLDSSASNLNWYAVIFYVTYCFVLFALQYLYEQKVIKTKSYLKLIREVNSFSVAMAIIVLLYSLLVG